MPPTSRATCGWPSRGPPGACARRRVRALARHDRRAGTIERHGPMTPASSPRASGSSAPRRRACSRGSRAGVRRAHAGPAGPALRAGRVTPPASALLARAAHPQGRLPGRAARPARRRGPRRARARRGHPREDAGGVSAGLQRTFASLSVPNYRRYFSGQVVSITGNWMQNVAEMWLVVQLTGNGVASAHRRPAVPADPAVRRLGRPARRPHLQAPAADDHADADRAARADAVAADGPRLGRGRGWSTRSCSRAAA